MAQGELAGQLALVTGATRGIGKAIALALAKDGATIVGTATTVEGAESISQYLKDASNAAEGIQLDVTDAAAADAGACGDRVAPWRRRDSRQQRRHHARQSVAANEGR